MILSDKYLISISGLFFFLNQNLGLKESLEIW